MSWCEPSRVEPPAPNVTEKKSGFRAVSSFIVFSSFSAAWTDLGGNNSKEIVGF
jgi:hypothetical protein